jgi:hypothetical protein
MILKFIRDGKRVGSLDTATLRLLTKDKDLLDAFEKGKQKTFMTWIPGPQNPPTITDYAHIGKLEAGDDLAIQEWTRDLWSLGITTKGQPTYSTAVVTMARLLRIRRTQAAKLHREARRLRSEGRQGSVSAIAYEVWMQAHRDDEKYGVFVERSGAMFEVKLKSWGDVIFSTPSAKRAAKKMAECISPLKIAMAA